MRAQAIGSKAPKVCIACGIFRLELQALRDAGRLDLPLRFLDSMLHLYPEKLEVSLTAAVDEELRAGRQVVLVYGDCHATMLDIDGRPGVARTEGINCCEIVLGTETYRALRRQGTFFLLPEWATRWREIFRVKLGLTESNAMALMRDMHSRLIYLDMGLAPAADLRELSEYCSLPWEVRTVSLDHLLRSVQRAERQLDEE